MRKRETITDRLMNEHIPLAGAPQIIVTRSWAYARYQQWGLPLHTGGFDSADYLAFSGPSVDDPLTDLTLPWAVNLLACLERE